MAQPEYAWPASVGYDHLSAVAAVPLADERDALKLSSWTAPAPTAAERIEQLKAELQAEADRALQDVFFANLNLSVRKY